MRRDKQLSRIILFVCAMSASLCAQEGVQEYFSQGQTLSQEKKNEGFSLDVMKVPGYKDPSQVPQASLNENNIEGSIEGSLRTNPEASLIHETTNTRPRYDLDNKDPMFTSSDNIMANPEKMLGVKATSTGVQVTTTRHTCTKGYDLIQKKCRWTKVPVKTGVRHEEKKYLVHISAVEAYQRGVNQCYGAIQSSNLDLFPERRLSVSEIENIRVKAIQAFISVFHGRDEMTRQPLDIEPGKITKIKWLGFHGNLVGLNTGGQVSQYLKVEVTTQKEIPTFELKNTNNCDDLESSTDQGSCEYISKQCVEGPSTKIIEGVPVYADCWAEEAIYQCRTNEQDTCRDLLKQGCYQIGSRCQIQDEDNRCTRWEQTYECQSENTQLAGGGLTGEKPFCLDGNCVNQKWDPNGDMIEALSKLAIFKEMQKDMDANTREVFKGKNLGCCRFPVGFKDCCKQNGWGRSIGLSSCGEEAKELAEQRKLNKCVQVGTYCAEKTLGVCTRKKTTFCCYNSKLSRVINEQGKAQLGLTFGSAENPQCQGLTLEQLTQIDFNRLDLSELFEELFSKTTIPNTNRITTDIQRSLSNQTYFQNDEKKKITQGRKHGDF